MNNRVHRVVGLLIVFFILIPACQATPPGDISERDLYGVWRRVVSGEPWGYFLTLNEDGTFTVAGSFNSDNPYDFGQYQLEGNTVTFEADRESQGCPGYRSWVAVEFTEVGNLQFQVVEQECPTPDWQEPIVIFERYRTE